MRWSLCRFAAANRRGLAAEEGSERRLEGGPIREAVLQREHDQAQFRHGALLGLQVDRLRIEECLA